MSASLAEVQELADQLLLLLDTRLRSGSIVIHFDDGRVQKVETNTVHRPAPRPLVKRWPAVSSGTG